MHLQSRNGSAVDQLRLSGQQYFETAVSAAVKRYHEEEIQCIKDNLAKTVSTLTSDVFNSNTRRFT